MKISLFLLNQAVVGFYVWLSVNDISGFIRALVDRINVVLDTTDYVNDCIGVKQKLDLRDLDSLAWNCLTMPIFLGLYTAKKDLKILAQFLLALKLEICGMAELLIR